MGVSEERPPLHHRMFLQRNHSIDVIQTTEDDDDDSESEVTSVPPSEESESVLRPLDSVELGFSAFAQGASGTGSGGGGGGAGGGGGGATATHTPQLQTALERAVRFKSVI